MKCDFNTYDVWSDVSNTYEVCEYVGLLHIMRDYMWLYVSHTICVHTYDVWSDVSTTHEVCDYVGLLHIMCDYMWLYVSHTICVHTYDVWL